LRDGNWHLSSEVARTLDIHTTTASKFLQRFAELGLVERQAHDSRTFEYRLRSSHLRFDVDLSDDAGPLREVVDFYVVYFQSLFEKILSFVEPTIQTEMEHQQQTDHQAIQRAVIDSLKLGV